LIGKHFDYNRHVFLTGYSGTGKTVLATNLLKDFYTTRNIDTLKMNFSA
jgi:DNA replication protein DnaC